MPSGPKKRAKAKKKQQRLGSASFHDDPDSRSRSSDDKETDTCDSVEDQEEDLIPKSPLGKTAYSAGEDYHKSETEKWVRVSNFEVGLPPPRSERATIDFDQVMDDEPNGTKSPDWETVDGETVGSLDKKGDDVLALNHGVKPEELEAVLQSAEKDYFSFGNAEPSKDDYESTSVGDSLVVEPGTEVADYSVSSGTVPCDSSLPDSEDQAENVTDSTSRDSQLAADPSAESGDHSAEAAHLNLSTQHFEEQVEESTPDVRLGAEEKSVVQASDEQYLHEQVEHAETVDPMLSRRLGPNKDVAEHLEAVGTSTDRVAESAHQSSSTGELVGSVSAGLHPWTESVAEVPEVADKSSARELVATPPEVDVHQAEVKTEDKDLYAAAECPEVQDGDENETEELKDASEVHGEPSSSYENLKCISDNHVVSSSCEGHFSASTSSIADGERAEEQIAPEMTTSEVTVELPSDELLEGNDFTGANGELEETTGEVKHDDLPQSSSSENVVGLRDTKSPAAEVQGRPNGHHVEGQSPPANNGLLTVDQVKDVGRDRSSPGCCGALYWIFGQAE